MHAALTCNWFFFIIVFLGVLRIPFHVSLGFNCFICEDSCHFVFFKVNLCFICCLNLAFPLIFIFNNFSMVVPQYGVLFNLSCLELNLWTGLLSGLKNSQPLSFWMLPPRNLLCCYYTHSILWKHIFSLEFYVYFLPVF